MRFFLIFIQLIFLLILFSWVISLDHQIDFFWKGVIFTSKLSNVFLVIIFFYFCYTFYLQDLSIFQTNTKKNKKFFNYKKLQ